MKIHKNGEMFLFDEISKGIGGQDQQLVIIQDLDNVTTDENGTNTGDYVLGVLQSQFDYTVTAEYDQMFDSLIEAVPGEGLLRKAFQLTGTPLGASGIFKRKFYRGGSHITFNIDFRIVSDGNFHLKDRTGSGSLAHPKAAADWLAKLCLPKKGITLEKVIKDGKKIMDSAKDKDGNYSSKAAARAAGKKFKQTTDAFTNDAPFQRTVRIKIGNMFESFDMVVESVNVKYSKENVYSKGNHLTRYGDVFAKGGGGGDAFDEGVSNLEAYQPLYADITMQVSTATVPTEGNTGLLSPQPKVGVKSTIESISGNIENIMGMFGGN